jgi:hypothetical protein
MSSLSTCEVSSTAKTMIRASTRLRRNRQCGQRKPPAAHLKLFRLPSISERSIASGSRLESHASTGDMISRRLGRSMPTFSNSIATEKWGASTSSSAAKTQPSRALSRPSSTMPENVVAASSRKEPSRPVIRKSGRPETLASVGWTSTRRPSCRKRRWRYSSHQAAKC